MLFFCVKIFSWSRTATKIFTRICHESIVEEKAFSRKITIDSLQRCETKTAKQQATCIVRYLAYYGNRTNYFNYHKPKTTSKNLYNS